MLTRPTRVACACVLSALSAVGVLGSSAASAQGIGQQVRAAELPELRAIGVPAAWRVARGAGVTVAVLDTGTDLSAPDLSGSVTVGPDYARGANPPGYQPPHLHGTYIASLVAGHGDGPGRSGGVIGVAPAARVLSVRVILDDQEPGFAVYNENAGYADAIAEGIRFAVSHGADVINMSLGSAVPTRAMRLAIIDAISHGVVVVASAGNNGLAGGRFTPFSYPASFTGVISVAAVGATGRRAGFSDRNASVVISAPGVNILGAGPGGEYLTGSGTSPAAAFVAGVAALIRSKYPRLTPALVTQALVSSARHRPRGGYSPGTGFGEVDAAAALSAAGRLAGQPAAAGLSASAHFGAGPVPGPVQVVHRSRVKIVTLIALAAAAAGGFLLSLALLLAQLRHGRSGRRRTAVRRGA
jgi:type VII secretion-associated serine protease mycosin